MYAEVINKSEPSKLIEKYFKQNESQNLKNTISKFEEGFVNDIIEVINKYKVEGLPDKMISSHLFDVFLSFIKKSMIELKADELDIDSTLYKNKMRFLFKGGWK